MDETFHIEHPQGQLETCLIDSQDKKSEVTEISQFAYYVEALPPPQKKTTI